MNLGANVRFDCANGGCVTMVGNATGLSEVGVTDGWAYWDDLHVNAQADLTLDVSGTHFVKARVETRQGATVMLFGITSREPNGRADIRVTGLQPETWYRIQFDGALAACDGGRTHAATGTVGELQFNNVVIPYE